MSVKKVLLFGMCGAGKDTQAELLSKEWGIPVFSLGNILREGAHLPSPWQAEIQHALSTGSLISTETARDIMKSRLMEPDVQEKGYILIGYPRAVKTLEDYLAYETPTHAVLLNVSREGALERSLKRARKDDEVSLVERRINRFFEEELPVWEELKKLQDVVRIEVDANQDIERVAADVLSHFA